MVKLLALSMYDNENAVIKMFKAGVKGYILKDCDPLELKQALYSLVSKGFYYSEMVTGKFLHSLKEQDKNSEGRKSFLTERETTFLKLACTELTYKEIAQQMSVSPRTVDGYRDDLFEKLQAKSRIGLVMFAIRNGIISAE
jgi:DNA-binding NarL/FixJ family response regulator